MIRFTVELPNASGKIDRHVIEIVRTVERPKNHADYRVQFGEEQRVVIVKSFDRERGWKALVASALTQLEQS